MPRTLAHPAPQSPPSDTPDLDAIVARLAAANPQAALPVREIYLAGWNDAAASWSRISGLSPERLRQVLEVRAEMAAESS